MAEDEHGHGSAESEEGSESAEGADAAASKEDEGDSNLWGGVGAGAGILGLIAGSTALALGRRKA